MVVKMSERNLEEEALKRQERLKSLKRKREDKSAPSKDDSKSLPTPKFRSYKPQDKTLGEHVSQKRTSSDVQNEVKDLLAMGKGDMGIDQVDLTTLAPRQPDWDLKRDVEKKLEKLARRTQKAMAEMIRDKLKEKQDLAEVPNVPVDV